jgi:heterodisulfide reductase subunit A-like polyferredoxin
MGFRNTVKNNNHGAAVAGTAQSPGEIDDSNHKGELRVEQVDAVTTTGRVSLRVTNKL